MGCPKNLVDSEHLVGCLAAAGLAVTTRLEEADTVVVNTCAFIRPAVEEAENSIREALVWKSAGRFRRVIVAGCLPQRFPDALPGQFPEVDAFLGWDDFPRIAEIVRGKVPGGIARGLPSWLPDHRLPRVISTPPFRAYLKLAEGCSNHCRYCLIPKIRGELRSRPPDSILREARRLAAQGVKELTLIAQDTTAYGNDLKSGIGLSGLLKNLDRVRGVEWIRILYAHPRGLTEELIETLAQAEKTVPYLDVPVQHASDRILKAMGRGMTGKEIRRRLQKIRRRIPTIALRTTLLVGFPGETPRDFLELMDFVREMEFDHLGAFSYFPETGTPAARLPGQVPEKVKEERKAELLSLQAEISRSRNESRIGRESEVLIEAFDPDLKITIARTPGQAPEIDGITKIYRDDLAPGSFHRVRIVDALVYDLVGEIIETSDRQPVTRK
ncbi:MAG: 30S ribosomal protein S12 methylthiotransferase RimO [Proteobacteria bacterium]|nr:30S ribosomal protein S12 methylthiotransferase RimO [Pseudomonadota bacterium]